MVSKMLLPEVFTSSNDFESYLTNFELLVELQNWKCTVSGTKTDEWPHYFALRLQKSSTEFYRILPEATRISHDETVEIFGIYCSEKPAVFRGRLTPRVQQVGENLTYLLGDHSNGRSRRTQTSESGDIRDYLVHRGFLVGIHHSQVTLELGRTIGDKDMNNANALERALPLEALIRIEEEEQTPRIAAVRRDETELLIDSVNKLVQQMSVGNEGNARSSDR